MALILTNAPLHYPEARDWMWNYCIYLGPYTTLDGDNCDMGIYLYESGHVSAAIVQSNNQGDYTSGLIHYTDPNSAKYAEHSSYYERSNELYRRVKAVGLLKE